MAHCRFRRRRQRPTARIAFWSPRTTAARGTAVNPGTPVLLMTGFAENVRDGVLSHGARLEVIMKPFSGSALTSRIAEMINSAQTAST